MYLLLLILISTISYADISKIRIYPSGIKVSFEAPMLIEEEKPKKKLSWWAARKAAKLKKKQEEEMLKNPQPPQLVQFTRFIRVINAINLTEKEYTSIDFYDNQDQLITQHIVSNTGKLSADTIFYMDRNSGRRFKGMLDTYHIPKNASYFQIGLYDQNKELIYYAEHPDFNNKNKILLSQYQAISPKQKIMLQIELLGDKSQGLTRVGAFYFTK